MTLLDHITGPTDLKGLPAHGLDATGINIAVLKRLVSTHRGKVTA